MTNTIVCPTCGSEGKVRWQRRDGTPVCDVCWTDFDGVPDRDPHTKPVWRPLARARFFRAPQRKVSGGAFGAPGTNRPNRVGSQLSSNAPPGELREVGCSQPRPALRDSHGVNWRRALRALAVLHWHSKCLLCGRLVYNAKLDQCVRCGGLCVTLNDADLELLRSRPTLPDGIKEYP